MKIKKQKTDYVNCKNSNSYQKGNWSYFKFIYTESDGYHIYKCIQ